MIIYYLYPYVGINSITGDLTYITPGEDSSSMLLVVSNWHPSINSPVMYAPDSLATFIVEESLVDKNLNENPSISIAMVLALA